MPELVQEQSRQSLRIRFPIDKVRAANENGCITSAIGHAAFRMRLLAARGQKERHHGRKMLNKALHAANLIGNGS